ncbi:MAG: Ig-like domain-containing protein, partial [Thermoplasmata archaeon]
MNVYAYDVDSNFCAESVQVYIDNFAPRVDSVHPDSGATNVPLDTKMEVQFNEPMNQNVDLDCVITLTPGAMVSWQWLDSTKVRGIPIPSLEPNTTYLVSVKAYDGVDSLKDMAGWLFDGNGDGQPGGDHIWGFTTGDTMAAWPTSEPQWEGVERSGCDSVDLFSNPYLPLLCGSLSFSFCG